MSDLENVTNSLFPDEAENVVVVAAKPEPPISLVEARKKYSVASQAFTENDELCIRDRRYFDGDQISDAMRAELKKRNQPIYTNNKIAAGINGMLGLIDAADSDPQAFPRTYEDQNAADVATKVLRYLADKCRLPETFDDCSKEFLIEGTCAAIVLGEPEAAWVEPIAWDEFFADPQSRKLDFSDARYLGIAKWFDEDQVKALYPEEYSSLGNPFEPEFFLSDKEEANRRLWIEKDRKRIRVVEMYFIDANGMWQRVVYCSSGFLDYGPSEYVDESGYPICPIIAASFEINRDNERYGAVRNMISHQDSINARQSKLLHLTNHRQVQQVEQAVPDKDVRIARREAAKADGVLPYGFQYHQAQDLAQGQMAQLRQSLDDLNRLAPTPAVLSAGANESGRSRQILQQAGYTELARNLARLEAFEQRIYEQLWLRAKQFFQAQMYVRVTDDTKAVEFLSINEPVIGEPVPQQVMGPDGQPMFDAEGYPVVRMVPQVTYRNRLAEMNMDIVVDRAPDTLTLQQETFTELARLAGSLQMSPFDPAFDTLIELSGLPNGSKIIEKLQRARQAQAQQQQGQMQVAEAEMQLEAQTKQAKVARDMAKAEKDAADAQRTNVETDMMVEGFKQPPYPDF